MTIKANPIKNSVKIFPINVVLIYCKAQKSLEVIGWFTAGN